MNGEWHKAKDTAFLTMDLKLGETRIAGLWWGCTVFMQHCWPKSKACLQVAGFISRTYIKQKQSRRKIVMRAGLKEAFYLSQNKQSVDARLPGCMLWSLSKALKNKAHSAIFCGFNVSSTTHRWDVPRRPLPMAGHALRKWEQSW